MPAMAGYSRTPLPRKLGIKPGHRVALLRAPEGFDATLGELPDGVAVRGSARGPLDVIVRTPTAPSTTSPAASPTATATSTTSPTPSRSTPAAETPAPDQLRRQRASRWESSSRP